MRVLPFFCLLAVCYCGYFEEMTKEKEYFGYSTELNGDKKACNPCVEKPAISTSQCSTMMEKILGHLNRMKEMHIEGTADVKNTTFYALACRTGANFSKNEDARRGEMIKIHQQHDQRDPIRNAGYRVDYYKNYEDAFNKLHIDGAAMFEKLCSLPFSDNWDAQNFHERLELIKKTFEEIASRNPDSAREVKKLSDYFHPPQKPINEDEKNALVNHLLVNLDAAIESTKENDQEQRVYYQRVFHIAADYNAHTYDRENRLEEYLKSVNKPGARSLAKAFVSLADDYKAKFFDNMSLYAVQVFQKAYDLVFEPTFRRASPEIKKNMIWERIKNKETAPNGLDFYKNGFKGTTTIHRMEVVNGVVVRNETQTIHH